MRTFLAASLLGAAALLCASTGSAADRWIEGKHYFRIQPAQPTSVAPGKVEVAEVLSYGCPACNRFLPIMAQMKKRLPAQAQIAYVHASFNTAEQWPMFQRAFYTAQAMNILDKTHEAMFNAVWGRGELAVVEADGRARKPPPTLADVAKFYNRTAGVDPAKFLEMSKSFGVETSIRRAEGWMRAAQVDQTPTIIVNGKYRLHVTSAGGVNELLELVDWLVQRELQAASAH